MPAKATVNKAPEAGVDLIPRYGKLKQEWRGSLSAPPHPLGSATISF